MTVITIDKSIKEEIAQCFIAEQHPGYDSDCQGSWFVVNGTAVVHRAGNARWSPWNDDDAVVSVDCLIREFGGADAAHASFGDYARTELDWAACYPDDFAEWSAAYVAAGAPDGDLGEIADYQVVTWAEDNGFEARIDEIEAEQVELAVSFALDFVPDSYDPAELAYDA